MKLKELRAERGCSQKVVADFIGCSTVVYSRYETGAREPSSDTLSKLASFYNVTVDYLLGREEAQEKKPYVADDLDKELITLLTTMSRNNKQRILDYAHGVNDADSD